MGRITTGVGLISGINTSQIIDQLMQLESAPKNLLQTRIDTANSQKLAFTDLVTRLTSLRVAATTLKKASSFLNTTATSSNENVLSATTTSGAALGSYQFQVSRLVSSQQAISAGFANTGTETVGAGTLTIELGGGGISSDTTLAQLNGGTGVRRGQFRITDRSGRSGVIDVSSAVSLDDVVQKINTSLDVSVKAEIQNNKLVLTDLSGQSNSSLIVTDLGAGHAAQDLGIAGSAAGTTLTGSVISYLGRSSTLAGLNDGLGIRSAGSGKTDFTIADATGATYDVSVANLNTMGQVIDAINTATGGAVVASVDPGSTGLTLTDTTGGGAPISVTAQNGSQAAKDLGIDGPAAGATLSGRSIIAGLDSVLLSTLRGGQGLNLGTVDFTDRAGNTTQIDFSSASSVQDVLDLINNNGAVQLRASLKDSGNGIQITDTSSGSGNLVIADASSTTASELGIAGTFTTATQTVVGANLQRQWVGENTQLSVLNGGRGIAQGNFTITNSLGASTLISIGSSDTSVGDVIKKINGSSIGVTASINANGDGILLTDTLGGGAAMQVTDSNSSTAANLGIAGTATGTTIDGSYEKTITVDATDTLDSVVSKINTKAYAISASVINDGSTGTPYRLSVTSRTSGLAGSFIFDAGATRLQTTNLVEAQDAAVFFGSAGSAQPVVITSSTNQLSDVIRGVTISLNGTSTAPVSLDIAASNSNVTDELNQFVSTFNDMVDKINELTAYNDDPTKRGILLGDGTVQQVESQMYVAIQSVVQGTGSIRMLSDIGLRVIDGGKLEFDEAKFQSAYAADPENVKKFFTTFQAATDTTSAKKGIATIIEDQINKLIDPVSGVLTQTSKMLDSRTQDFQNRISDLDTLLNSKRARLEAQFTNMETVLAQLQSQQSAIASLANLTTSSSSSSSSSKQ